MEYEMTYSRMISYVLSKDSVLALIVDAMDYSDENCVAGIKALGLKNHSDIACTLLIGALKRKATYLFDRIIEHIQITADKVHEVIDACLLVDPEQIIDYEVKYDIEGIVMKHFTALMFKVPDPSVIYLDDDMIRRLLEINTKEPMTLILSNSSPDRIAYLIDSGILDTIASKRYGALFYEALGILESNFKAEANFRNLRNLWSFLSKDCMVDFLTQLSLSEGLRAALHRKVIKILVSCIEDSKFKDLSVSTETIQRIDDRFNGMLLGTSV